jgi:hypothetical protein
MFLKSVGSQDILMFFYWLFRSNEKWKEENVYKFTMTSRCFEESEKQEYIKTHETWVNSRHKVRSFLLNVDE